VREVLLAGARANAVPLRLAEAEWVAHADWQKRAAVVAARATASDTERFATASLLARDADARVRSAALGLLSGAAGSGAARGELAPRAREIALALIADRDSLVQRAARRVARLDTAPAPRRAAPTPRPLDEYERLVKRWVVGSEVPRVRIHTAHGPITMELYAREAPLIVEAFLQLARRGYYRDTYFHRVVPNFVVQDGDARGDGSGSAGFILREQFSRRRHERGAVGLATAGPDTGSSQYYLCHSAQPHLDGAYTVFGRVVDGFAAMDRVRQGDRMLRIEIL
jgi:cyclophilin family peptidyl-prolyl cis-trans isomerase